MMKLFASWILLAFVIFGRLNCSRISPADDEYRKRLEEYYKSIGVNPPSYEKEVEQTIDEYQTPVENHQESIDHQPPFEQQVPFGHHQQVQYEQGSPATEIRHDLSPDEMYQQRLKEYYERLKEHNAVIENPHVPAHQTHEQQEQQYSHHYEQQQQQLPMITQEPEQEQSVDESDRAADQEYQKRLDEYYRQFDEQRRQQEQQQHYPTQSPATEEPRQDEQELSDYQRQLDEYYMQLERHKAASQTTTSPPVYKSVDHEEEESQEKPPTLTIDLEGDQRRYDPTGWLPRPACPRPFLPNAYIKSMDAEKALFGVGEQYLSGTFQFECNGGYEPDPRVSSMEVRCQNGQLSPLPRCKRIEVCEGIPKPMHGYVDVHRSQIKPSFKHGLFQVGTKFSFTCNHYAVPDSISPVMESECMDGGVWSSYPKCVAMPTCDFFTYLNHVKSSTHHLTITYRNVTIMRSPLHHGGHNVIPGSVLQHACAPGYEKDQASGPMEVVCMQTGHWTEFPRCTMSMSLRDSCTGMPDINAIYRNNLVAKTYRILQVGDQVTGNITFMCQDNYEPKYPDMVMTVSCHDKQWTPLPECQLKPLCDTNIQIPYGARIVDSRLYFLPGMQDRGYLPGSYIEFLCEPRSLRQITVRRSKVSCQQGGTWTRIQECQSGR